MELYTVHHHVFDATHEARAVGLGQSTGHRQLLQTTWGDMDRIQLNKCRRSLQLVNSTAENWKQHWLIGLRHFGTPNATPSGVWLWTRVSASVAVTCLHRAVVGAVSHTVTKATNTTGCHRLRKGARIREAESCHSSHGRSAEATGEALCIWWKSAAKLSHVWKAAGM